MKRPLFLCVSHATQWNGNERAGGWVINGREDPFSFGLRNVICCSLAQRVGPWGGFLGWCDEVENSVPAKKYSVDFATAIAFVINLCSSSFAVALGGLLSKRKLALDQQSQGPALAKMHALCK